MRIESDLKLDFKDVHIRPKRSTLSSRSEVSLQRTFIMPNAKHPDGTAVVWSGVPLCASNMSTVGTFEMAKALVKHQCLTAIHKHYSVEEWKAFDQEVSFLDVDVYQNVVLSLGSSEADFEKTKTILEAIPRINILMMDVANGYSESFVQAVRRLRQTYPSHIIIAGNVVTAEMTEELILSGVDIVKVGIASGGVCITRTQTGIAYPQLSCVIECADASHGLRGPVVAVGQTGVGSSGNGLIMSDGGCRTPSDIAKAFGAGADFVMLGSMLAGHDECGGEIIVKMDHQTQMEHKYMEFYGMSSRKAMEKYHRGVAEYRSSEGKEILVLYKGSVHDTIKNILGGLRSTCTYVGAKFLKELSKRTTFIRIIP